MTYDQSVKNVRVSVFIASVVVFLIVGFFLGIVALNGGKSFISMLVEDETKADVSHPRELVRAGFQLKYPGNWKIDREDKDYDPDRLFSVESPGAAQIMFALGRVEVEPEKNLANQIAVFQKVMGSPPRQYFEKYGKLVGKGAIFRGSVIGSPTTVRVFSFGGRGRTVMITEQWPNDDTHFVQEGFKLIENTFSLR